MITLPNRHPTSSCVPARQRQEPSNTACTSSSLGVCQHGASNSARAHRAHDPGRQRDRKSTTGVRPRPMNARSQGCARARPTRRWTLVLRAGSLLARALCALAPLGGVRRRATGLVSRGGFRVGRVADMVVGGHIRCRLRRCRIRHR